MAKNKDQEEDMMIMMIPFDSDSIDKHDDESDFRQTQTNSRSKQDLMVTDDGVEYRTYKDDQNSESTTPNNDHYRDYSTSPARLDGAGILQDLDEMSECADRIDSILEYGTSTANNASQRRSHLRSLSPYSNRNIVTASEQDGDHHLNSEEVD